MLSSHKEARLSTGRIGWHLPPIIRSVPPEMLAVEISPARTLEEVTGRLRNVEQRKKNTISAVDKEGRLLLTEEEWLHHGAKAMGPPAAKAVRSRGNLARCMREKEADQKKEEPTDDGGAPQPQRR